MNNNQVSSPLVSVVTPVYNGSSTLQECHDSVMSQTYKQFEWILIDDHSTDNSLSLIKGWSDPRIRTMQTETNRGGPAAPRNLGARNAQGKYLALVDQDDLWEPDKLEFQVEFLEKHQDIALFSGNQRVFGSAAHKRFGSNIMKEGLRFPSPDEIYQGNPFLASTIMMRKDAFEDVGGFDEHADLVGRDEWELALRLALKYKTACDGKVVGSYRWHGENLSHELTPYVGMSYVRKKLNKHFEQGVVNKVMAHDHYTMAKRAVSNWQFNLAVKQIWESAKYKPNYFLKGVFLFIRKLLFQRLRT